MIKTSISKRNRFCGSGNPDATVSISNDFGLHSWSGLRHCHCYSESGIRDLHRSYSGSNSWQDSVPSKDASD
jgi:hypothetical protein